MGESISNKNIKNDIDIHVKYFFSSFTYAEASPSLLDNLLTGETVRYKLRKEDTYNSTQEHVMAFEVKKYQGENA